MTKLKPCPFCGGEAELLIVPGRVASWLVKCKKGCCNQMPHVSDHDAIEEWNTRWDNKETKQKPWHWENDKYGNTLCSVCGGLAIVSMTGCLVDRHLAPYLSDYCPHCGSKMDKGVTQDD